MKILRLPTPILALILLVSVGLGPAPLATAQEGTQPTFAGPIGRFNSVVLLHGEETEIQGGVAYLAHKPGHVNGPMVCTARHVFLGASGLPGFVSWKAEFQWGTIEPHEVGQMDTLGPPQADNTVCWKLTADFLASRGCPNSFQLALAAPQVGDTALIGGGHTTVRYIQKADGYPFGYVMADAVPGVEGGWSGSPIIVVQSQVAPTWAVIGSYSGRLNAQSGRIYAFWAPHAEPLQ